MEYHAVMIAVYFKSKQKDRNYADFQKNGRKLTLGNTLHIISIEVFV